MMEALTDLVGTERGTSCWFETKQADVDAHAETVGDGGWIHNDVERSAAGPCDGTLLQASRPPGIVDAGRRKDRQEEPEGKCDGSAGRLTGPQDQVMTGSPQRDSSGVMPRPGPGGRSIHPPSRRMPCSAS